MRLLCLLPCLSLAVSSSPAQTSIDTSIAALIDRCPAVQHGRIGFKFIDLGTGGLVAQRNASDFFTPASNTKLYTTALALERLGPEYRFRTQLRTSAPWQPGQPSIPDLQVVGGGDPSLSGRSLPYQVEAREHDDLAAVKQMADQLLATGIRKIEGDVTGVAARYPGSRYPDGWTVDDALYDYGAAVSSLAVNDNTAELILRPTEMGELAAAEFRPGFPHFILQNTVLTDDTNAAHVELSRIPGTNELVVSGSIGRHVDAWRQGLGVEDPALFAAEAFTQVLRERGIEVSGEPRADYDALPPGTLICERTSGPLNELLRVVNKESQNLHAEMLLREVAFVRTGLGTQDNGVRERNALLADLGPPGGGIGSTTLEDGSGLARQNLTTPDATVALLRYMWTRPDRDVWLGTLPIGNLDGSLRQRFRSVAGAHRVLGKTGSLSHVNALSGYLGTDHHRSLAFSIMVNGTPGRDSEVRDFIDRLCALFLAL